MQFKLTFSIFETMHLHKMSSLYSNEFDKTLITHYVYQFFQKYMTLPIFMQFCNN